MRYGRAITVGLLAGLRTMLPPAVVSWRVRHRRLQTGGRWLKLLGKAPVAWTLTALAVTELLLDKLPSLPDRTEPAGFAGRLVSGALAGAAIGADGGRWRTGALLGAAGAAVGTLGGHAARARLAAALGRDLPAALVEDAVAIAGTLAATKV